MTRDEASDKLQKVIYHGSSRDLGLAYADYLEAAGAVSPLAEELPPGVDLPCETHTHMTPDYGAILTRLMKEATVSPKQVADHMGVDVQSIYRWLKTTNHPRFYDAPKLADFLGVRVGALFGEEQEEGRLRISVWSRGEEVGSFEVSDGAQVELRIRKLS